MGDEIDIWTGGGVGKTYADSVRLSFPLLHIRATSETLTVRIVWKKHALCKDQVSAVRRYNAPALFFTTYKGIEIIHTHPQCPQFVVFSPWGDREATLEGFKRLGYNVKEDIGGPRAETS